MGHQALIRKMTVADVPAVYAIDRIADKGPWTEKLFGDCLRVGYDCWVVCIDLKVVGYGITSYGANEAHLLKLAVLPEFQRQGLGQKLLQHLISMAKIQGADEMFLEVRVSNTPAKTLYEKYNFVEVGVRKGYYPADEVRGTEKEDALTMALPLW